MHTFIQTGYHILYGIVVVVLPPSHICSDTIVLILVNLFILLTHYLYQLTCNFSLVLSFLTFLWLTIFTQAAFSRWSQTQFEWWAKLNSNFKHTTLFSKFWGTSTFCGCYHIFLAAAVCLPHGCWGRYSRCVLNKCKGSCKWLIQ